MVNLLSNVILVFAVLLVALGVVLTIFVHARDELALATIALALGAAALLAGLHHPLEAGVVAISGITSAAILRANRPPGRAGDSSRGFELSLGALVLVGALALALNDPVIGDVRADVAVDALLLGALFTILVGGASPRPIRAMGALNGGILAGVILLVLGGPPVPRGLLLGLAAFQLAQALAATALDPASPESAG